MSSKKSSNRPYDPSMDHLASADYEHVYEPSEDSFLLMDSLIADKELLRSFPQDEEQNDTETKHNGSSGNSHRKRPVCVEIGCGSGIILSCLALVTERKGSVNAALFVVADSTACSFVRISSL